MKNFLEPQNGSIISFGFLIVVVTLLIGAFDLVSGSDFSFSIFYLIAPAIASWWFSRKISLLVVFVNISIWQLVDFYSNRIPPVLPQNLWNFASRLLVMLLSSELILRLKRTLQREKRLSAIDPLTQVLNTRSFRIRLDQELSRASRYDRPISLAFLDIDNFKTINDQYGHTTGDQILKKIAGILVSSVRATDAVGRIGGDEFSILLLEAGLNEARAVITSLQKTLNREFKNENWPITVSIGVITCEENYCDSNRLINLADQLMYSVKEKTKNSSKFASLVNIDEDPVIWEEDNYV